MFATVHFALRGGTGTVRTKVSCEPCLKSQKHTWIYGHCIQVIVDFVPLVYSKLTASASSGQTIDVTTPSSEFGGVSKFQ